MNDLIFERGILSSKIKHLPIMTLHHSPILYRKSMKFGIQEEQLASQILNFIDFLYKMVELQVIVDQN